MKRSLFAASILAMGFAVPALAGSNTSDIDQIGGSGLSATVTQGGNATNKSTIKQNGSGSQATVTQDGPAGANTNTSNIQQIGHDDKVVVTQTGNSNKNTADTRQLSYGNNGPYITQHKAIIIPTPPPPSNMVRTRTPR